MSNMRRMWIVVLALLLLAAHLSLSALVPLKLGESAPPWWVGGMLIWPFAEGTNTFISEELANAITPILSMTSGLCFLLAAVALLRWRVPDRWFSWLIVTGAVFSMGLQLIWFTGWAVFPLLVDAALLWMVFQVRITVGGLRAS